MIIKLAARIDRLKVGSLNSTSLHSNLAPVFSSPRTRVRPFASWMRHVVFMVSLAMPLTGVAEANPTTVSNSTKNNSLFNSSTLNSSTMVLIDTTHRTLTVMKNNEAVVYFKHISIGRGGAAQLHMQGDDTTPKGTFRVISEKAKSQYTLFIGLDYPTVEHAELALKQDKIEPKDHQQIIRAHARGLEPPASTPLGGAIGIHGLGEGDLSMHRQFNWTHGCIALDNDQIRELARWIEPGVRVSIQ